MKRIRVFVLAAFTVSCAMISATTSAADPQQSPEQNDCEKPDVSMLVKASSLSVNASNCEDSVSACKPQDLVIVEPIVLKYFPQGEYCTLRVAIAKDQADTCEKQILQPKNWCVLINQDTLSVFSVRQDMNHHTTTSDTVHYYLYLNGHSNQFNEETILQFEGFDVAKIHFQSTDVTSASFLVDKSEFSLSRLAEKAAIYEVEYALDVSCDIHGSLRQKKSNLSYTTKFDFASDGVFRLPELSGTHSSSTLGLSGQFIKTHRILNYGIKWYYLKFGLDFVLETWQDSVTNELSVSNKCLGARCEFTIPGSDVPAMWVRDQWGYYRGGTPVKFRGVYLGKGVNEDGDGVSDRLDLSAEAQISFSPLFIVDYKSFYSCIYDRPEVMPVKHCWGGTLRIAQRLETMLLKFSSILALIPGDYLERLETEKEAGNNYFYYQYRNGRQPPDFQQRSESSFGFSVSF